MGRFYTLYNVTILNVHSMMKTIISLFGYPVAVFVVLIVSFVF